MSWRHRSNNQMITWQLLAEGRVWTWLGETPQALSQVEGNATKLPWQLDQNATSFCPFKFASVKSYLVAACCFSARFAIANTNIKLEWQSHPSENLKSHLAKWLFTKNGCLAVCGVDLWIKLTTNSRVSEAEKLLDLSQYIFLFTMHQSSSSY